MDLDRLIGLLSEGQVNLKFNGGQVNWNDFIQQMTQAITSAAQEQDILDLWATNKASLDALSKADPQRFGNLVDLAWNTSFAKYIPSHEAEVEKVEPVEPPTQPTQESVASQPFGRKPYIDLDKKCPECNGHGLSRVMGRDRACPSCKGTGQLPAANVKGTPVPGVGFKPNIVPVGTTPMVEGKQIAETAHSMRKALAGLAKTMVDSSNITMLNNFEAFLGDHINLKLAIYDKDMKKLEAIRSKFVDKMKEWGFEEHGDQTFQKGPTEVIIHRPHLAFRSGSYINREVPQLGIEVVGPKRREV